MYSTCIVMYIVHVNNLRSPGAACPTARPVIIILKRNGFGQVRNAKESRVQTERGALMQRRLALVLGRGGGSGKNILNEYHMVALHPSPRRRPSRYFAHYRRILDFTLHVYAA